MIRREVASRLELHDCQEWWHNRILSPTRNSCPAKRYSNVVSYFLPMIFGFISGTLAGFVLVYLFESTFSTMLGQIIAGIIVGAIFGGIIGSISGDLNASGDAGSHRLLVAAFFGAIGGVVGATKLAAIWAIFKYFHIPIPFRT